MVDQKEFVYKILPQQDGSILFCVEEVKGGKVHIEELLGVMVAYLHESCGDIGMEFADDIDDENKNFQ